MVLGWIPEGKFDLNHAFLLGASSVLTAAFASFVLGKCIRKSRFEQLVKITAILWLFSK